MLYVRVQGSKYEQADPCFPYAGWGRPPSGSEAQAPADALSWLVFVVLRLAETSEGPFGGVLHFAPQVKAAAPAEPAALKAAGMSRCSCRRPATATGAGGIAMRAVQRESIRAYHRSCARSADATCRQSCRRALIDPLFLERLRGSPPAFARTFQATGACH